MSVYKCPKCGEEKLLQGWASTPNLAGWSVAPSMHCGHCMFKGSPDEFYKPPSVPEQITLTAEESKLLSDGLLALQSQYSECLRVVSGQASISDIPPKIRDLREQADILFDKLLTATITITKKE